MSGVFLPQEEESSKEETYSAQMSGAFLPQSHNPVYSAQGVLHGQKEQLQRSKIKDQDNSCRNNKSLIQILSRLASLKREWACYFDDPLPIIFGLYLGYEVK